MKQATAAVEQDSIVVGAPQFAHIPVEAIQTSPSNPRKTFAPEKLHELAASIASHGVLEPLVVRALASAGAARYELVAGERRWRAAQIAGLAIVPCMVKQLSDDEVLEIQLIENLQRDDLSALDQARGYRTLIDRNPAKYSAAAIATKLGLSEKWVWDRMKLLDLVPEAQQLLQTERIGVGHAILVARLKPADQTKAIHPASGGLFEHESGRLFGDRDPAAPASKPSKFEKQYTDCKPVSVRELDAWIARHIRFDVAHMAQAAPLEFASTAQAVERAAAEPGRGRKVVPITHDWSCPQDAADDKERTYGSSAWQRADGQEKSRACEHAVLGVIAAGPGYGQAFDVCIARDTCDVHWHKEIAARTKTPRARASEKPGGAAKRAAAEAAQAKREALQRQHTQDRWKAFVPALRKAIDTARAKLARGKLPGPLFAHVLKVYRLPSTTTVATLPQGLLVAALADAFNHPWSGDESKLLVWAKLLKVDVKACEPKAATSPPEKAATRKAGKKR